MHLAVELSVEESLLADEFVRVFGAHTLTTPKSLRQLCAHLGIDISVRPMPADLRGHNSLYEDRRSIVVSDKQSFPGADEHTVLHELREVFEHVFKELGSGTCVGMEELEIRAEQFASFARAAAFEPSMTLFVEGARAIDHRWVRYGAYFLIMLGGLAYVTSCFFLPYFEDVLHHELKKRNVRT